MNIEQYFYVCKNLKCFQYGKINFIGNIHYKNMIDITISLLNCKNVLHYIINIFNYNNNIFNKII